MKKKKIALVVAAALFLTTLGSASVAIVNAGGQPGTDFQVRICHFPRHTSSNAPFSDFVAGNQNPNATACAGTRGAGSIPIWVSERSCQNGHGAVPAPNGTSCTNH